MSTIGITFGSSTSITFPTETISDGNKGTWSAAKDLGDSALGQDIQLVSEIAHGSGADALTVVEAAWSPDDSNWSSGDGLPILAVTAVASSDSHMTDTARVKGRYLKVRIANYSGGSITGGDSTLVIRQISGDVT